MVLLERDAQIEEIERLLGEAGAGRGRLLFLGGEAGAGNEAPPVLMGQLFHYIGSPNHYGIPAFYELHMWAWKHNPGGTFADWNPNVSCDGYSGQDAAHGTHP